MAASIETMPGGIGHKVLIVIPTTRRPVVVASLKPRPQLPASFAVALGDFRALPIAADYDRLIGRSGPIGMRLPDVAGISHELRLSEPFESGRSWEVPVSLAHFVMSAGRTLAAGVDDADVIVWSTGAVDIDLAIADQSYHVEEKLRSSLDLFAAARGRPVIAFLPTPSGEASISSDLRDRVAALGVELLAISSVEDALRRLSLRPSQAAGRSAARSPETDKTADGGRRNGRTWLRAALLLAGATAALGAGLAATLVPGVIRGVTRPDHHELAAAKEPGNPAPSARPGDHGQVGQSRPPDPAADDARAKAEADARAKAEADALAKAEADARVKAEADALAKAEADARVKAEADALAKAEADARAAQDAIIAIDEQRAPPGRSCLQVLFSGVSPEVLTLRAKDGKFPPSRMDGLCGLTARIANGSPYSLVLDPALLRVTMPGAGNAARILRDKVPVPLTYWILARPQPAGGSLKELRFTHELVR